MFRLRPFIPDDFDTLWALDQICFPCGIAYSRAELRLFINAATALTLVAIAPEDVIAGFVVSDVQRNRGHLITIDVHPDHRRAGLGSMLMLAVERRLCELGVKDLRLEVAVDNVAALSFYKRHGYSLVRTIPRYYNQSVDALLMSKPLVD